jgi:tetratricopeptide (TPR) repeat protein
VIERDPKDAEAYTNRGVAHRSQGNNKQAIADFSKAIKLDPKHAEAYYWRGIIYKEEGLKASAIADFQNYLEYEPLAYHRVKVKRWIQHLKK